MSTEGKKFVPKYGANQNIVLFRDNEANVQNKRPNYTGYMFINGKNVKIALWGHHSAKGGTILAGAYTTTDYKKPQTEEDKNLDKNLDKEKKAVDKKRKKAQTTPTE